jgi:threonine/homoserine/homoserine lactone efflux protein
MTLATELLGPLALFILVTSVTPGPNNIMLLTSGLNYGVRRSIPHLLGVALGFAFMTAVVGLGLGAAFVHVTWLYTLMKIMGTLYLLWLAWRIATAEPRLDDGDARSRPLTFLEAAAFQWVNPKGWVMAIGAISAYAGIASFPGNVALITGFWLVVGMPTCGIWVLFGAGLKRILDTPSRIRAFNIAMGVALVASLWPIVKDIVGTRV